MGTRYPSPGLVLTGQRVEVPAVRVCHGARTQDVDDVRRREEGLTGVREVTGYRVR